MVAIRYLLQTLRNLASKRDIGAVCEKYKTRYGVLAMIDGLYTKIRNRLGFYYKLLIKREKSTRDYMRWVRDHGDETLRLNYPLTVDSVVFDVGGFYGEWAERIAILYDPNIYVFEPIAIYAERIKKKFLDNKKVYVYSYGLSDRNEFTRMAILGDASSKFRKADEEVDAELCDIQVVLKKLGLSKIDLMKINIEGGEYPLLQKMIDTGAIKSVINLQVQFHDFVPEAKEERERIRRELMLTHYVTYEYEFVWENWKRKGQC